MLQVCLRYYEHELVELACQCPAVVCCRCSPTQKARIVKLLQRHTRRRTCAIGEPRPCPVPSTGDAHRGAGTLTGAGRVLFAVQPSPTSCHRAF